MVEGTSSPSLTSTLSSYGWFCTTCKTKRSVWSRGGIIQSISDYYCRSKCEESFVFYLPCLRLSHCCSGPSRCRAIGGSLVVSDLKLFGHVIEIGCYGYHVIAPQPNNLAALRMYADLQSRKTVSIVHSSDRQL